MCSALASSAVVALGCRADRDPSRHNTNGTAVGSTNARDLQQQRLADDSKGSDHALCSASRSEIDGGGAADLDEHIGVDAEAVHVTVVLWHAHIVQQPRESVGALRVEAQEVENAPPLLQDAIVCTCNSAEHTPSPGR